MSDPIDPKVGGTPPPPDDPSGGPDDKSRTTPAGADEGLSANSGEPADRGGTAATADTVTIDEKPPAAPDPGAPQSVLTRPPPASSVPAAPGSPDGSGNGSGRGPRVEDKPIPGVHVGTEIGAYHDRIIDGMAYEVIEANRRGASVALFFQDTRMLHFLRKGHEKEDATGLVGKVSGRPSVVFHLEFKPKDDTRLLGSLRVEYETLSSGKTWLKTFSTPDTINAEDSTALESSGFVAHDLLAMFARISISDKGQAVKQLSQFSRTDASKAYPDKDFLARTLFRFSDISQLEPLFTSLQKLAELGAVKDFTNEASGSRRENPARLAQRMIDGITAVRGFRGELAALDPWNFSDWHLSLLYAGVEINDRASMTAELVSLMRRDFLSTIQIEHEDAEDVASLQQVIFTALISKIPAGRRLSVVRNLPLLHRIRRTLGRNDTRFTYGQLLQLFAGVPVNEYESFGESLVKLLQTDFLNTFHERSPDETHMNGDQRRALIEFLCSFNPDQRPAVADMLIAISMSEETRNAVSELGRIPKKEWFEKLTSRVKRIASETLREAKEDPLPSYKPSKHLTPERVEKACRIKLIALYARDKEATEKLVRASYFPVATEHQRSLYVHRYAEEFVANLLHNPNDHKPLVEILRRPHHLHEVIGIVERARAFFDDLDDPKAKAMREAVDQVYREARWDSVLVRLYMLHHTGVKTDELRRRWARVEKWLEPGTFDYQTAIDSFDKVFNKKAETFTDWKTAYQVLALLDISKEEIDKLIGTTSPAHKIYQQTLSYRTPARLSDKWSDIEIPAGATFLKLGAQGAVAIIDSDHAGRVIAFDDSPQKLLAQIAEAEARGDVTPYRFRVALGKLTDPLPFADRSIDQIAIDGTLLADPQQPLFQTIYRQFLRVLVSGGRVLLKTFRAPPLGFSDKARREISTRHASLTVAPDSNLKTTIYTLEITEPAHATSDGRRLPADAVMAGSAVEAPPPAVIPAVSADGGRESPPAVILSPSTYARDEESSGDTREAPLDPSLSAQDDTADAPTPDETNIGATGRLPDAVAETAKKLLQAKSAEIILNNLNGNEFVVVNLKTGELKFYGKNSTRNEAVVAAREIHGIKTIQSFSLVIRAGVELSGAGEEEYEAVLEAHLITAGKKPPPVVVERLKKIPDTSRALIDKFDLPKIILFFFLSKVPEAERDSALEALTHLYESGIRQHQYYQDPKLLIGLIASVQPEEIVVFVRALQVLTEMKSIDEFRSRIGAHGAKKFDMAMTLVKEKVDAVVKRVTTVADGSDVPQTYLSTLRTALLVGRDTATAEKLIGADLINQGLNAWMAAHGYREPLDEAAPVGIGQRPVRTEQRPALIAKDFLSRLIRRVSDEELGAIIDFHRGGEKWGDIQKAIHTTTKNLTQNGNNKWLAEQVERIVGAYPEEKPDLQPATHDPQPSQRRTGGLASDGWRRGPSLGGWRNGAAQLHDGTPPPSPAGRDEVGATSRGHPEPLQPSTSDYRPSTGNRRTSRGEAHLARRAAEREAAVELRRARAEEVQRREEADRAAELRATTALFERWEFSEGEVKPLIDGVDKKKKRDSLAQILVSTLETGFLEHLGDTPEKRRENFVSLTSEVPASERLTFAKHLQALAIGGFGREAYSSLSGEAPSNRTQRAALLLQEKADNLRHAVVQEHQVEKAHTARRMAIVTRDSKALATLIHTGLTPLEAEEDKVQKARELLFTLILQQRLTPVVDVLRTYLETHSERHPDPPSGGEGSHESTRGILTDIHNLANRFFEELTMPRAHFKTRAPTHESGWRRREGSRSRAGSIRARAGDPQAAGPARNETIWGFEMDSKVGDLVHLLNRAMGEVAKPGGEKPPKPGGTPGGGGPTGARSGSRSGPRFHKPEGIDGARTWSDATAMRRGAASPRHAATLMGTAVDSEELKIKAYDAVSLAMFMFQSSSVDPLTVHNGHEKEDLHLSAEETKALEERKLPEETLIKLAQALIDYFTRKRDQITVTDIIETMDNYFAHRLNWDRRLQAFIKMSPEEFLSLNAETAQAIHQGKPIFFTITGGKEALTKHGAVHGRFKFQTEIPEDYSPFVALTREDEMITSILVGGENGRLLRGYLNELGLVRTPSADNELRKTETVRREQTAESEQQVIDMLQSALIGYINTHGGVFGSEGLVLEVDTGVDTVSVTIENQIVQEVLAGNSFDRKKLIPLAQALADYWQTRNPRLSYHIIKAMNLAYGGRLNWDNRLKVLTTMSWDESTQSFKPLTFAGLLHFKPSDKGREALENGGPVFLSGLSDDIISPEGFIRLDKLQLLGRLTTRTRGKGSPFVELRIVEGELLITNYDGYRSALLRKVLVESGIARDPRERRAKPVEKSPVAADVPLPIDLITPHEAGLPDLDGLRGPDGFFGHRRVETPEDLQRVLVEGEAASLLRQGHRVGGHGLRVTGHESLVGAPLGAPNSLSLRGRNDRSNPVESSGLLRSARNDRQGASRLDFAHAQWLARIKDPALKAEVRLLFESGITVQDFQRKGIEVLGRSSDLQRLLRQTSEPDRNEFLVYVGMLWMTSNSVSTQAVAQQFDIKSPGQGTGLGVVPVGTTSTTTSPVVMPVK